MRLETMRRLPSLVAGGILNGVLQVEQHARRRPEVAFIHQHGAALQQVAVAFQGEVDDGVEQRVAGADEGRQRLALGRDEGFLEGDALITRQHGFADADEAIPVAHRGRNMGDLEAAGLALPGVAAELFEGFEKEGFDVVRLQAAGIGALHVLADALHTALASMLSCTSWRSSSRDCRWVLSSAVSSTVVRKALVSGSSP
jgi:hypothetical protein